MSALLNAVKNLATKCDRYVLSTGAMFGATSALLTLVGDYDDLVDVALGLGFGGLGVLPYLCAVTLSAVRDSLHWSVWTARVFVTVFGLFDVWFRYRSLWNPSGSTDAITLFTLPMLWAPVVFGFAALAVALLLWIGRASRSLLRS